MLIAYCAWRLRKGTEAFQQLDFNYHNPNIRSNGSMRTELREAVRPRYRYDTGSVRHVFDPVQANMPWCVVSYNTPELSRLFVESFIVNKVWTERQIRMPYMYDLLMPDPCRNMTGMPWDLSQVVNHLRMYNRTPKCLDPEFFDLIDHKLPSADDIMGLGMLDRHRREQMY